jgi:hypothetical protein
MLVEDFSQEIGINDVFNSKVMLINDSAMGCVRKRGG